MNLRRLFVFVASLLFLAHRVSAVIITNVTPPLESAGRHIIDIYGNGFAPGNVPPATLSVKFNGAVSSINPNNVLADSHIQVTNVPSTNSGYITVSINGGTAAQSPQKFIIISTNAYVTNFTPVYGDV